MQVEYATDVVFQQPSDLTDIYEVLIRTSIHAVKADHVATFLGRKLSTGYSGELGTDFTTHVLGTRIKHHMGPAAIKMYDKFGCVLRIETTINDVSFFKHHRMVEQKDGRKVMKLAPVRRADAETRRGETRRSASPRLRVSVSSSGEPARENERTYKGFNFFCGVDQDLFEHLVRGELLLNGVRNKHLRTLTNKTAAQVSQLLKRLRLHGLIKKIGRTYKYYLTDFGRRVAITGLKLKNLFLIPMLAAKPVL